MYSKNNSFPPRSRVIPICDIQLNSSHVSLILTVKIDLLVTKVNVTLNISNGLDNSFQVSLKSLEVEDLLTDSSSERRFLMVSYSPPEEQKEDEMSSYGRSFKSIPNTWKPYLSTSCPEVVTKASTNNQDYSSLPDHLDTRSMFQSDHQAAKHRRG